MKYKIVGTANYIIGGFQTFVSLVLIFLVIPRIQSLYQDMALEIEFSYIKTYLPPILNLGIGVLGIFLGHKLFSSKNKQLEKYFTISIIYLVITFITTGVLAQLSVLTSLIPIYSLTSSLK
jgi:hypothetical protein